MSREDRHSARRRSTASMRWLICLLAACLSCGTPRSSTGSDARSADDAPPSADVAVLTAATAFCGKAIEQEATWRERCLGGPASDWRAALALRTSCAEIGALLSRSTVRYHAELAQA